MPTTTAPSPPPPAQPQPQPQPPRKRLQSDDILANLSSSLDGFRRRIGATPPPDGPVSPVPAPTPPPAATPTDASECSVCLCSLGLLKFKYVCKNCDKLVCGAHSKHQIPLPDQGLWKEVRVCDVCYEQRLKRRAGAIETTEDTPADDASLCGILFSGLVEEQDDTLDEMLYLGSFRMGSRSLASRNFNPNIAIWIERMFMLTPAELLSFKPQKDKDKEDFLLGIGEVKMSIHMTDILHIEVDEHYPRILTVVRSDGRIYRLRTKEPETCADIAKKLHEAMQMFQNALHKLQRGLRPEDNSVTCVTVQHSPMLDERVVRVTDDGASYMLDLYPASVVRVYATSPSTSGVATYAMAELFQQAKRCTHISSTPGDDHELIAHVDVERVPTVVWATYRPVFLCLASGLLLLAVAEWPLVAPYVSTCAVALAALGTLTLSAHLHVFYWTYQWWVPQHFRLRCTKIDCVKNTVAKPLLGQDVQIDPRFMDACKGDVEEARRKYGNYLAWRHDKEIDTILLRPHPHFTVVRDNVGIKESYTQITHKRDKLGHMVAIELAGSMRKGMQYFLSQGVVEEDVVTHLGFYNEFLWTVLDPRPHPDGLVFKIIDMNGVTMGDFGGDVVNFAKKCSAVGEANYPERLFKIFIVNPPSWFSMIWKAVSPMVNPKTREKIHVVRGQKEIQKALLEYIDAENLPEQYGGTCDCAGGCLANSEDEVLMREYVAKLNSGVDCKDELKRLQSRDLGLPTTASTAAAAASPQKGAQTPAKPTK
ncbi:Aste57867_20154 [Aphanomyces stellatus]|uniref:Aste57867_20154 protein n=1 Tax=Aphanomyces stellatus TaxID=120398 RepID=A0A485LEB8_9STRA|nr:hypothetical protein As57867_020088 [Aphanomyces stellatus]VFT96849.1 Aste57867_20154 [Aphanomyces stellatus]